jgi:hypothetical protein
MSEPAPVPPSVRAGVGYVGALLLAGYRLYSRYEPTPDLVRFPSMPA